MILLTGGAGFIGSNIAADLNEAGTTDIFIADRLGSDGKWRNIAKRRFADIVFPDEIETFLEGRRNLSAVIHMGAISSTTAVDADEVVRSNFRLSARLWEWCTKTQTPFIYASSAATYGDGANGFADDDSDAALDGLKPLNLYGWSKLAFDKWALDRSRRGSAPPQWAGLKFFNVYGPNEAHKGDMQSLVTKTAAPVKAGLPINLFRSHKAGFADGEQLRDFVYVKDCSSVVMWMLSHPSVTGLFNLGTGKARSFRDLILASASAFKQSADIRYIDMPEAIRSQYQYFTEANMMKLRSAGYEKAFSSIEDGIEDYVKTYLSQADTYR